MRLDTKFPAGRFLVYACLGSLVAFDGPIRCEDIDASELDEENRGLMEWHEREQNPCEDRTYYHRPTERLVCPEIAFAYRLIMNQGQCIGRAPNADVRDAGKERYREGAMNGKQTIV